MDKQVYQNFDFGLYSVAMALAPIVVIISGQTDKTSVTALLMFYSILFWVVCFKTGLVGNKLDFSSYGSLISKVMNFILIFFPFLAILTVILWVIILVTIYYDRIIGGNVSDYYSSFMRLASFIIAIEIYMIFSEKTDKMPPLSMKTYSILRFLAVLSALSVITVGIVLKFYVTDC
jgi:hypothetical protein